MNFRYPEKAIGFHSGWCEKNDSPTNRLALTRRIPVRLEKQTFEEIFSESCCPPYMLKKRDGKQKGLSSGAGSTLVKHDGAIFKIKRNGYKLNGFIPSKITDRAFSIKDGLMEETQQEIGGAMGLADAVREINFERRLVSQGFLVPYKTVGLYKIEMPFPKDDAVSLIQKIDTDLRADELCMIILSNLIFDVFEDNCSLNIKNSAFDYPSYSIRKALKKLKDEYAGTLFQIGTNIGSIYKDFHKAGIIRGISNSWYGNELVCDDGNIGSCDLESCFSIEEIGDRSAFDMLCRNDFDLAVTAFYDSMNFFENSILSAAGSTLIDGFREGYKKDGYKALDKLEMDDQIKRFMKIREKIVS